mmetsp:Transcript_8018/g.15533  ORF Transcript_8018/g.15533 Transcript_8018/m.15533 type:complete len:261 (-) Transcript_8018:312-1094(-)
MARIPRRLDSIRETRRRPTPHNHPVVPVGGILWGDSHAAGVPVLSGPPQRVTTEPGCLPAGVPRHRRGRPGISRVPSVAVFAGTDLADPDPLFHAQHGLRGADLEGSRGGLAPHKPRQNKHAAGQHRQSLSVGNGRQPAGGAGRCPEPRHPGIQPPLRRCSRRPGRGGAHCGIQTPPGEFLDRHTRQGTPRAGNDLSRSPCRSQGRRGHEPHGRLRRCQDEEICFKLDKYEAVTQRSAQYRMRTSTSTSTSTGASYKLTT